MQQRYYLSGQNNRGMASAASFPGANLLVNSFKMKTYKTLPFVAVLALCCNNVTMVAEDGSVPALTAISAELPLNTIKLPAGFSISIFAEVDNARSLAMS